MHILEATCFPDSLPASIHCTAAVSDPSSCLFSCCSLSLPCCQEFGIVASSHFHKMKVLSGKLNDNCCNTLLCHVALSVDCLVCFPAAGASSRFCLVSTEDFKSLKAGSSLAKQHETKGVRLLTGLSETGFPCLSPHPTLSTWLIDKLLGLHQKWIEQRFLELVAHVCLQQGFWQSGC